MAAKCVLLVAALAGFVAFCAAQTADQNSLDAMARNTNTGATCSSKYQALEAKYYPAGSECQVAVYSALKTYVKTNCPSTVGNSTVWKCMSGWNGVTYDANRVEDWRLFVKNCEILYIANRKDTGESEDGFRWIDNSCFPRFNDLTQFISYLQTGRVQSGSAVGLSMNLATLLAGVAMVLAFLYQ